MPLPEFDERLAILKVHCRDKKLGPDVDLEVMAKGTPGMSGADLANLVNEAALFAVRRGAKQIERIDFESARDRVMMGARRESLVLTGEEKRTTAYHEGGHAVLAAVLPNGDPVHKVTILPTRHGPRRHPDDARGAPLAVEGVHRGPPVHGPRRPRRRGDRLRPAHHRRRQRPEQGHGLARRMVREWGMSDRIGPMALESQQHVFLGEDLMNAQREYSDDTARLIDEEIERSCASRRTGPPSCSRTHRRGLDLVAEALLEQETIDGSEVVRLVQQGMAETQQPQAAATADSALIAARTSALGRAIARSMPRVGARQRQAGLAGSRRRPPTDRWPWPARRTPPAPRRRRRPPP